MSASPPIEPGAPLLSVINGASGSRRAGGKSELIDAALEAAGRSGELLMCQPAEPARVAAEAAARAVAARTAMVAVGGDGTLHTVAQVAFGAACATLLLARRHLRLHIECGASARYIRALTPFVGNNRLQLDQLGLGPRTHAVDTSHHGRVTAVLLKPVGMLSMIGLMLHGAMGTLGEAQGVERFEFNHLAVRPSLAPGRRGVKVACDGEVRLMRAPLEFRVLAQRLYLLMPQSSDAAPSAGGRSE